MKYKKIIMLAILLVALLTVSAVSAADNTTNDVVGIEETTDEVVSVEENNVGTFTDLANEIANATDEFNLTRDYAYISSDDSEYKDGIKIVGERIVINGNGHTINGCNQSKAFRIYPQDVILNNITFLNGYDSTGAGGAVSWSGDNGVLANCSFINCHSSRNGGAVSWGGDNGVLANCSFMDCSVYHIGSRTYYNFCYGGAVDWYWYNGVIANCSFERCSISSKYPTNTYCHGGAVYCFGEYDNCNLTNCSFVECSSEDTGGAVNWGSRNNIIDKCSFVDCSAHDGGAVYSSSSIFNCNFVNCHASNDGGAINYDYGIISNCSFVNSSSYRGGGIFSTGYFTLINSRFEGGYAEKGSDWYSTYASNLINITPHDITSTFLETTDNINMSYGDSKNLIVTLSDINNNLLVGHNITISLNNVSYTKTTDNNGQLSLEIPTSLLPGSYIANISYPGNAEQLAFISNAGFSEYAPSSTTANVVVNKGKTIISCDDISVKYLDNSDLAITLTNEASGKPITNAKVVVNLNDEDYNVKTDSKGRVKVSTNVLIPGKYTATITYLGNAKYTPANATARVFVSNVIGDGTITDLATEIANAEGELNLTRNYNYVNDEDSSYKEGIIIDKSIVINGNGHTINGNSQARIFEIRSSNVVLNDIDFVNGYAKTYGGTIVWNGNDGSLTNCSFMNSYSDLIFYDESGATYGGAVYWTGGKGYISGCIFENCFTNATAYDYDDPHFSASTYNNGGAVHMAGANAIIDNCSFIKCSGSHGGAVHFAGTLVNCCFINCIASDYGGAVYTESYNSVLSNCSFINCTAGNYGGAVYTEKNNPDLSDCSFINCTAGNYGGAVYIYSKNCDLANCSFVNCTTYNGYGCGGAVYLCGDDGALSKSSFVNCSSERGGAIFWAYHNGILSDCNFVNCAAKHVYYGGNIDGGAAYWNGNNGTVNKCIFINCHAEYNGGGIYFKGENCSLIDPIFKGNSASDGPDWYSVYPLNAINENSTATVLSASDVTTTYGVSKKLVATLKDIDDNILTGEEISIVLNDKEYALTTNSKGQVSLSIPTNLAPNTYVATITYAENDEYASSSTTADVVVKKADSNISAVYNNASSEIVVTLTNANTGKAITNANVKLNLNGATTTAKTNTKGQAKFSTAGLSLGTAKISYAGNTKYKSTSTSIVLTTKSDMIISAVYDADNNELMATLTNGGTGKAVSSATVQVNINGATTTAKTNTQGQATISTAGLPLGKNTATISYAGNSKYNSASTSISFDVKTKVIVTDVYAYSDRIVAKLTNGATGKTIANANMIVEINGIKYNAKSDNKGQLTFKTTGLNLPSSYDLTISYRGNNMYTASSATVAVDLGKANMMITTNYHADKQKLVATLKNSKTGKIVSNANMIIDLNGVKTTYKSNNQGKITLLTDKFAPGTYVGTVTYPGNTRYNSISAVFKVDV